jgi:heme-binding NEAT domain protein
MKYKLNVGGATVLLNQTQLETMLVALQDAYQMSEMHVGTNKGSQGYNNSYVPTVEIKQPHDWLVVSLVADDFVEATKLAMLLCKPDE